MRRLTSTRWKKLLILTQCNYMIKSKLTNCYKCIRIIIIILFQLTATITTITYKVHKNIKMVGVNPMSLAQLQKDKNAKVFYDFALMHSRFWTSQLEAKTVLRTVMHLCVIFRPDKSTSQMGRRNNFLDFWKVWSCNCFQNRNFIFTMFAGDNRHMWYCQEVFKWYNQSKNYCFKYRFVSY